jgi:glycerol-3-phosphate dehydrogenase
MADPWTAFAPLPGGDIRGGDFAALVGAARRRWPDLSEERARRLARAYGTRMECAIGGEMLGDGLSMREVDHLVATEWARTAEDILWRRSRLGLHVGAQTRARLEHYLGEGRAAPPRR